MQILLDTLTTILKMLRPQRSYSQIVIIAICWLLISACSSSEFSSHKRIPSIAQTEQRSDQTYNENIDKNAELLPGTELYVPWQTWSDGLSINNIELKDLRIATGDTHFAKSDFTAALSSYRAARAIGNDELESLALRIASVELLSGDSPRSVVSLSKFFQSKKQDESQISDSSALFFGYAYGQSRNYEQSLAWFSQALRSQQKYIRDRSSLGIRALLRIIPNPAFEEMSFLWKTNETISTLIAEERAIRQSRPAQSLQGLAFFWSGSEILSTNENKESTTNLNSTVFSNLPNRKVAVLLPLSGRFAKMGESIKKGLELAAELSLSRGTPLELNFKDLTGNFENLNNDTVTPSTLVAEAAAQGATVVVGPLISEQASEIAESARRNSIAAVLLAKGGSATLGEGVYRFGLTYESQANSLISTIMRYRSNPRIALVYPNDESGLGFTSAVQAALNQFHIKALFDYTYQKGNTTEMLAHVSELEINPPEFVIFGDNLKSAVEFFGALSPAARKAIIPVGSALWDNPIEIMQSKTVLSGAIYVSPFYPDLTKPIVSEFVARFKEKNTKTPDFFAAQGFDVGLLLASATSTTNSVLNPPSTFEGITGTAQTTSYGEILRELAVLRLAHGSIGPLTELPIQKTNSTLSQENESNNALSDRISMPPAENTDPTIGQ